MQSMLWRFFMNYDYIENLVKQSKDGDEYSKEKLIEQFRPFIINLSKRIFISGYDMEDIQNECYRILLRCLSLYKMETHRFVAYATNGIKNSINDLIRKNLNSSKLCGTAALAFDNYVEETFKSDTPEISDILCGKYDNSSLRHAIKQLTSDERELVRHIFFCDNTLKSYAEKKEVSYSYAVKKKRHILDKLFMHINIYNISKEKI